jgi:hypothetical protein
VKNTVGRLVGGESGIGKTPREVSELHIVDPACGSGSFLLGAYQYLLNWHLDWYVNNDLEKALRRRVILTQDNKTYRLSMDEKRRILLNNIYGVDLDPQAVEVTKLSLLLKVVEDPGQLTMFSEGHILPDLGNNIKCGNSLIGMDYFDGQLMADPDEMARVNPFDWEAAFPQVFDPHPSSPKSAGGKTEKLSRSADLGEVPEGRRGFDAVIGNPPYGASFTPSDATYFNLNYKTFSSTKDVYTLFIEKSLNVLKGKGLASFIVPSGWTGGPQYVALRSNLIKTEFKKIILLPFDIFEDAYVDTLIFVVSNNSPTQDHFVETFSYPKREKIKEMDIKEYKLVKQADWDASDDKKFILNPETIGLLRKLSNATPRKVEDVCIMRRGVLFDKALLSATRETRYLSG